MSCFGNSILVIKLSFALIQEAIFFYNTSMKTSKPTYSLDLLINQTKISVHLRLFGQNQTIILSSRISLGMSYLYGIQCLSQALKPRISKNTY
jgi:hypothetical protein